MFLPGTAGILGEPIPLTDLYAPSKFTLQANRVDNTRRGP